MATSFLLLCCRYRALLSTYVFLQCVASALYYRAVMLLNLWFFQLLQNIAIKNLYIKDDGSGPSDKTVGSGGKQAVREAPGTELLHRDAEMFPQLGRTFASPCGWRAGLEGRVGAEGCSLCCSEGASGAAEPVRGSIHSSSGARPWPYSSTPASPELVLWVRRQWQLFPPLGSPPAPPRSLRMGTREEFGWFATARGAAAATMPTDKWVFSPLWYNSLNICGLVVLQESFD